MLIDTHVHFFKPELAARAIGPIQAESGYTPFTDGTPADTAAFLARCGVDAAVSLHIANHPHTVHNVNNFAASVQSKRMLCFGSLHPGCPEEEIYAEAKRIKELGLRGIKLHPDYQGFFMDDKRLWPIMEAAGTLGLPVLFHAGWDPHSPRINHGTPRQFADLHHAFPKVTMISAHVGCNGEFPDEAFEYLAGTDIYLDTAIAYTRFMDGWLRKIIRAHSIERILFGSDCPWGSPLLQLAQIRRLELTEEENDHILWKNACELFGFSF